MSISKHFQRFSIDEARQWRKLYANSPESCAGRLATALVETLEENRQLKMQLVSMRQRMGKRYYSETIASDRTKIARLTRTGKGV